MLAFYEYVTSVNKQYCGIKGFRHFRGASGLLVTATFKERDFTFSLITPYDEVLRYSGQHIACED